MRKEMISVMAFAIAVSTAVHARAESLIYGIQVEQLEYRLGESNEDILAWDFDAIVGSDELKFVWRSEAEYEEADSKFETLENQARLQVPISTFYDAVAGIRLDSPKGADRVSGVLGVHGLAEQWFEVDADLFLSEDPSARFEVEYEGLITQYVTFTPSLEVDLPFTDDEEFENGAWGPTVELGARLSYDIIDRSVSPYIGVHYEHLFGKTADIAEDDGKSDSAVFGVVGVRLMY